jgi:NAD-dependent dihydropyrimidine dehydrogenase PreA subunit
VTTNPRSRSAAVFQEIHNRALSEWKAVTDGKRLRILIGTATCGRAAGALDVLKTIEQELAQRKIDAIVTQVGCAGHCYAEPLVIVAEPGYPPICYGYVPPGIASRLVADYIEGDNPCLEFALGALEEFDSLTEAEAMMGSGGMVVLDEDNCMVDSACYFLDFTQRKSCSKCTKCGNCVDACPPQYSAVMKLSPKSLVPPAEE